MKNALLPQHKIIDLYIATGPFHVFNCINLKLHENRNATGILVIVDVFSGAKQLSNSLIAVGIFQEITLLAKQDYNQLISANTFSDGKFNSLLQMCSPIYNQSRYARFSFSSYRYRHIYMAGFLYAFATFTARQIMLNGAKLFYFDDGLGTRINGEVLTVGLRWVLMKRIGFHYQMSHISGQYFYSPQLVTGRFSYPMLQQVRPNCNDLYDRATMKKAFAYVPEQDSMRNETFIYLHGGYDVCNTLQGYAKADMELAAITCNTVKNAIVFVHPASAATFGTIPCAPKSRPVFEVSCMLQDIEQKVLITSFSAAAFNPKFVFDKEPYVILTYKLFGNDLLEKLTFLDRAQQESVLHRMLFDVYRDKSKIFVPNTKEEFLSALHTVAERINDGKR